MQQANQRNRVLVGSIWIVLMATITAQNVGLANADEKLFKQKTDATTLSVPNPMNSSDTTSSFHASIVYSDKYLINLAGFENMHPFDIKKYKRIHDQLVSDGVLSVEQTLEPKLISDEDLLLIHTKDYLTRLTVRENVARYLEAPILNAIPVSLEKGILGPFRFATGGTLHAARQALTYGIGINIGGGYHHAKPDSGEGFCLYADVPIAIRRLQQEQLIRRAVVIDVDVHQGNGTAVCLAHDDSTFTFSMHQADIYPIPKATSDLDIDLDAGTGDDEYLKILDQHLSGVLDQAKADICFIVGGCDTLAGDPLASLEMTHAGIARRDLRIVAACAERKLPVVYTTSGGYSKGAWQAQYLSIKGVIEKYGLAK